MRSCCHVVSVGGWSKLETSRLLEEIPPRLSNTLTEELNKQLAAGRQLKRVGQDKGTPESPLENLVANRLEKVGDDGQCTRDLVLSGSFHFK